MKRNGLKILVGLSAHLRTRFPANVSANDDSANPVRSTPIYQPFTSMMKIILQSPIPFPQGFLGVRFVVELVDTFEDATVNEYGS